MESKIFSFVNIDRLDTIMFVVIESGNFYDICVTVVFFVAVGDRKSHLPTTTDTLKDFQHLGTFNLTRLGFHVLNPVEGLLLCELRKVFNPH